QSILGDDVHIGCSQIFKPRKQLCGITIFTVGMTDRKIVRADTVVDTIGNAHSADVAAVPRPSWSTVGLQAVVFGFRIESQHAYASKVGQFAWRLPIDGHRRRSDARN